MLMESKRKGVRKMDREIWEVAEAMAQLGYDVRITKKGHLRVHREGVRIATFRFPPKR